MDKHKRIFTPGGAWLYLKLYTKPYFGEKIMIKLNSLLQDKTRILKWFFVRYYDLDFHIRLRILLSDPKDNFDVLSEIKTILEDEIKDDYISLSLETYSREIERYDSQCIEQIESLFYFDSLSILPLFMYIDEERITEDERWKYGLLSIDKTLSDFCFDTNQKKDFASEMNHMFAKEHNKNKTLNKELNLAYLEKERSITEVMNTTNIFSDLLSLRSEQSHSIIREIQKLDSEQKITQPLTHIIASYIHMNCNRLFQTEQRKQEYILYDFLTRFYKKAAFRESFILSKANKR